ncbi:MAG: hypothetical protein NTY47_08640 [Candidatus Omnitrophica bacterium]|nr:hypothetical protein [Candidatus Omnitrophota bacterium]
MSNFVANKENPGCESIWDFLYLRYNVPMKNKYILFVLAGLAWLAMLISCAAFAEAASVFAPIEVKGSVNLSEIGGNGLRVVSTWADKPYSPLDENGGFITEINNQRPQKISITDEFHKVRALAVALPGYSDNIVFDARSTAMAVLLQDSSVFSSNESVIVLSKAMDKSASFQNLVAYLRKNLPKMSLNSLLHYDEYVALVENCERDIFGQDQVKIRDSLQAAEKKLDNVLR